MTGYIIRGPCPAKIRLCPTHPHGGTPVAILQDGGGTAWEGEGRGRGPEQGRERPAKQGAFAPHFWGGANLHPLFLILGPGELPQGGP